MAKIINRKYVKGELVEETTKDIDWKPNEADLDTVKVSYDGADLLFDVGGTVLSHTVSLKDFNQFGFSFNADQDVMKIYIDDVEVASGGSGFSISSNETIFIGCDKNGVNQINGRLNIFKITR